MQPTPESEAANHEVAKDLAATPHDPETERRDAQAENEPVEIDEPQKRGWRFWRRRNS
jgi:hypothetical protein